MGMRPFELEIVRKIRTDPRRPGAGGRSIPRKDVWIRGTFKTLVGTTFIGCIRDGDPSLRVQG